MNSIKRAAEASLRIAAVASIALLVMAPQAFAQNGDSIENEFNSQMSGGQDPAAAPQVTMPVADDNGDIATPSADNTIISADDDAADAGDATIVQPSEQTVAAPVATTPAAPKVADPLEKFRAAAAARNLQADASGQTPLNGSPDNPLGPGGQLPVGAQLPATAYALDGGSTDDMQSRLEQQQAEQKKKLKQQVFNSALESLLPLSPEDTRRVLDSFKVSREAAETPITIPTAKTTVQNVPLDPSASPLTIKTSPGYVTTVTILDMTGAPWAIQDISWAGKFNVTTPEEGGHVIRITPQSAHGVGNISIRLVDLITPITFTLSTGIEEVDYRFDARIPKQGPLAKTPLIEYGGLKSVAGSDETLVRVLDGTAIENAEKLKLDGVDGGTSAWRSNDKIYLRTPLTLLSPAWDSSATSADGMNVYTLRDTPVILLSDHGQMVKVRVVTDEGKL